MGRTLHYVLGGTIACLALLKPEEGKWRMSRDENREIGGDETGEGLRSQGITHCDFPGTDPIHICVPG